MATHKTALFGLGRAGSIHLENLLKIAWIRVEYIVDEDVAKASDLLKQQAAAASSNIEVIDGARAEQSVFHNPQIQSVIIATPTRTHETLIVQALNHGKHVFCEKPISHDVHSIKHCYDVAAQRGLVLFCSFNRRFDPSNMRIKQKLCCSPSANNEEAATSLGRVFSVRICSRDNPYPSWEYLRTSGSIFHDCSCHDLDLLCWLLAEFPNKVFVTGNCFNAQLSSVEDCETALITLKFPSRVVAVIESSRCSAYGYDQRLEINAARAMLCSENQRDSNVKLHRRDATECDPIKFSFPQRYAQSYVNALNAFFCAVQNETAKCDVPTMNEVVRVCVLAELCKESNRLGKAIDVTEAMYLVSAFPETNADGQEKGKSTTKNNNM